MCIRDRCRIGCITPAFLEAVPVGLDDIDEGLPNIRGNIGINNKVLGKFGKIPVADPMMDVGSSMGEGYGGVTDCFPVLFEFEDATVDVITVVHGNVMVHRFGSPYLGWHINNKSRRKGGKGCESGRARVLMIMGRKRQSRKGELKARLS